MKKTIKVPAKLNLTLDVLGVSDGYHLISSLVCSVNLYERVTVKPRKDRLINLKCKGIDPCCDLYSNNAYKAVKLFLETFDTKGVDVVIDKRIPVGAGMGGSSADVSGVLNCMNTVFEKGVDLSELANALGSDTAYMLKGGWAVISGRGEQIDFKNVDRTLYMIILTAEQSVSAKSCYQKFDFLNESYPPCTQTAFEALVNGDEERFCELAKNDLTNSAISFVEEISFNLNALKKAGAPLALMTGSGSATVGGFFDKKQRDMVFKKLKKLFKGKIYKAHTV